MHGRLRVDRVPLALCWCAVWLFLAFCARASADEIVLHLKSGDRVSGAIITEDSSRIVISNRWTPALAVPLSEVVSRETAASALASQSITNPVPPVTVVILKAPTNAVVAAAATRKRWKGEAQVGLDLIYDTTQQEIYHGRLKLDYEQPYKAYPKEYFRNSFDYLAEYGRSDSVKTSDRMNASDKAALDLHKRWYAYNLAGIGYNKILKIDLQYEEGPGLGYHLINQTNFMFNTEAGFNYQSQYRSGFTNGTENVQGFYYRLAEDLTWKIRDRVTFTEKYEFFPRYDLEQYRFRFESNLSYELWKRVALNLTLLDMYDSSPAPGVERNELQIRSSLGLKF